MTDNEVSATPSPIDVPSETAEESTESFADLLSQFERSHLHKSEDSPKQLEGTVVSVTADSVYLDIGYKTEGVLLRSAFPGNADAVTPGDKFPVSVKDCSSLEEAFAQKSAIVGTVTALIKGGFSVDIGVRAFMPASRSGVREAGEMEDLVGQEITCRIRSEGHTS